MTRGEMIAWVSCGAFLVAAIVVDWRAAGLMWCACAADVVLRVKREGRLNAR